MNIPKLREGLKQAQSEMQPIKEALEQLNSKLKQEESQKQNKTVSSSSQTNTVEHKSQATQHEDTTEIKKLGKDKQTILGQLEEKVKEIAELNGNLQKLQEENTQLKEEQGKKKSTSTEMETQTDLSFKDARELYDKYGKVIGVIEPDTKLSTTRTEHSAESSKRIE